MEKNSHPDNAASSVKEVIKHLLPDLNQNPNEAELVLPTSQREGDVPPPSEVLRSPKASLAYHLLNQGFVGGSMNFRVFVRDKRVPLCGKSSYALGRSLFKKVVTEKDECASSSMASENKKKAEDVDEATRLELKGYLQEWIRGAKKRNALKKAEKVKLKAEKAKMKVASISFPRGENKRKKFTSSKEKGKTGAISTCVPRGLNKRKKFTLREVIMGQIGISSASVPRGESERIKFYPRKLIDMVLL